MTTSETPEPNRDEPPGNQKDAFIPQNMKTKFACPHCGQNISADMSLAGQVGGCPSCGVNVSVPEFAQHTGSVEYQPQARPAYLKPRVLIAIAVIGLLFAAGIGAFVVVIATGGVRKVSPAITPEAATDRVEQDRVATEVRLKEEAAQRQAEARSIAAIKRNAALARLTQMEAELGTLRRQLREIERESEDYNAQVTRYKMEHKAAITAIEIAKNGASAASDSNKSDGARFFGGLAAGMATGWALRPENRQEMKEVADQMISVDSTLKQYEKNLSNIRLSISTMESEIGEVRKGLD